MMNERFRELIEQAHIQRPEQVSGQFRYTPPKEFSLEKLLELVVQECAGIADRETSQPCASYGELIKKHFGVES